MQDQLKFVEYVSSDAERLINLISSEEWPFHGSGRPDPEKVRKWVADGDFEGEDNKTFWICLHGQDKPVGLIAIHELTDDTPIFDLRLRSCQRNKKLGPQILKWLAGYIFTQTDKLRVEGHTRADNLPMRKVFRACGWVKEAHHRKCWPDSNGQRFDAITYAVLKEDWQSGTTTPVNWHDE
ncbi:MAG: GNAT family N-acetyltransferase [Candidatus Rifleibacteriota bacterium]